jgi:hypothetical protein
MNFKRDFITNSSSTSFIITNLSDKTKSLLDFAKENIHLLSDFNKEYDQNYTEEEFLKSVMENNFNFEPKKFKKCIFGDEDCTIVGQVYDYQLRYGGKSKNFKWKFKEYHR